MNVMISGSCDTPCEEADICDVYPRFGRSDGDVTLTYVLVAEWVGHRGLISGHGSCHSFPRRERLKAVQVNLECGSLGTGWNEEISDSREDRDEALQASGRSEPL